MKIFEKQGWQLLAALLMIIVAYQVTNDTGNWYSLNLDSQNSLMWFWIAIFIPIIHQIYVVIFWRLELHYKWMSKTFGSDAFKVFVAGFTILILMRPISVVLLGIADPHTFTMNPTLRIVLLIICSVLPLYLGFSVKQYFGFKRAMGLDHFDEQYRKIPFVKKGIFKYSSNAMYTYGFLALYLPGFIWMSKSVLIAAILSHIFIWIHYYTTEKPDFKHIYGQSEE